MVINVQFNADDLRKASQVLSEAPFDQILFDGDNKLGELNALLSWAANKVESYNKLVESLIEFDLYKTLQLKKEEKRLGDVQARIERVTKDPHEVSKEKLKKLLPNKTF